MVGSLQSYVRYFENKGEIREENKKAVKWFLNECAVEGLTEIRQQKYVFGFTALLTKFVPPEVNLNTASLQQLKQIVSEIHRSEYDDSTQCFLKQCLKKFYKYKCNGVSPKKVAFIKTTEKKKTPVRREDLYTPEQIHSVVGQLRSIRDKAFVLTQYESGARTGEMLNATLGDVFFDDKGDSIRLVGLKNTPDRINQLISAGFYLREWIRMHPFGKDPYNVLDQNAPLWIKIEKQRCKLCLKSKKQHLTSGCPGFEPLEADPLTLANMLKRFTEACLRAGVRKRSYRLYNLRHTRITEVAHFLSQMQLCKFAGWKPGSGQFERYVHLVSEDVNKAIREQYHIGQVEKPQPLVCALCGRTNPSNCKECLNCRRPLTLEATYKVDQVKDALKVLVELQEQGKLEELVRMAGTLRMTPS